METTMQLRSTDTATKLKQFILQIKHLEDEKKEVLENIRDIYSTAQAEGFNPKVMRKLISLMKRKQKDIEEEEMLLETYRSALNI